MRTPTHRAPTHPGEILAEEFLGPLGIADAEAADRLGISTDALHAIIGRRSAVTPDTAASLERVFGLASDTWLNLQRAWDAYHHDQ